MNYIYDIVVNFNIELYNFYEWEKQDNIINIKKIPLFMVNNKLYKNLKYNNIKVNKNFLNLIKGKTNTYDNKIIKYSCLITNNIEITALLFNNNGQIIKKSCLLLDEEEQVLNEIYNKKEYNIEIICNTKGKNNFNIRAVKKKKEIINNFIKSENNIYKFKYIYYDYFNEEENNIDKIKQSLYMELNTDWNNNLNRLYNNIILLK